MPCYWMRRTASPAPSTGTLHRHPGIARIKRHREVETVSQAQDNLLEAAVAMLRPGGHLIYAVCSLQPEEGAPRIEAAIARRGMRLDPFLREYLAALPEALTTDVFRRTHPGLWRERGGMGGFFAARLIRL